jgi:iron complex outermembrane receptor protein
MTVRSITLCALLMWGGPSFAGDTLVHVDMPAQSLARSLRQFAEQAGIQLAVETSLTADKQAPAIKGDYSTREVLDKLLNGTGLSYKFLDDHTVAIGHPDKSTRLPSIGSPQSEGNPSADASDQLSEVVVTASKRGNESILQVPIGIQAMSGAALQQKGALEFNDYFRGVPGLSVFDQGPGDKRYIIRGVNTAGASAVGLFIDDVIFTDENAQDGGGREPDLRMFDINRVEVLKGPQGTTFGSSALSGVIRYITNKPDLNTFSATARTAITSQKYADGVGTSADMAVNFPVIPDKLAVRASGYFVDRPGFISNRFESGVNNDKTWAARFMIRLKIDDASSLNLMYMYQDAETDGNPYYDNVDYYGAALPPLSQANLVRTGFSDRMQLGGITYENVLDAGTITIAASGERRQTDFIRDSSQAVQVLLGLPDPSAPGVKSTFFQPKERTLYDVEARFASQFSGPVQLLGGFFAQSERRTFGQLIYPANDAGNVDRTQGVVFGPVGWQDSLKTNINEQALFGEITWNLTEKLKLIGGARVFRFEDSFQPDQTISLFGIPGPGLGPKTKSNEFSAIGRGNVSYSFSKDAMAYAQIAQGYRPGGANDRAAAAIEGASVPGGFKSDSLMNYELGYKQAAFDKRLTVTTAVYFIDWKNIQEQLQAPTNSPGSSFPYIGNGGGAQVVGAELEANVRPITGLTLEFTGGYTGAKITKGVSGGGSAGDRMPYVPRFTASSDVNYEFALGAGLIAFVGGNVSWTDSRTTDFPENAATYYRLRPNTIVDLRSGIEMAKWEVEVLAKNVFQNNQYTDVFTVLPGLTTPGYIPNPPRTFWLQASTKF